MSPSPSFRVVNIYPAPSRFPNKRVTRPTTQHSLSKTPSTWTLTGAEGQAGAKTPIRLGSLRQDTLDGDDPQDSSPVVSQYNRNRPREESRPDRPKPSILASEPELPKSAPALRATSPQTGDKSSLFGWVGTKLKLKK